MPTVELLKPGTLTPVAEDHASHLDARRRASIELRTASLAKMRSRAGSARSRRKSTAAIWRGLIEQEELHERSALAEPGEGQAKVVAWAPPAVSADLGLDGLSLPKDSRDRFYLVVKRAFDVVAACVLIVLLAPVWIVAALAVKLTSRGPVLYQAPRVGLHGAEFTCYKFRSMYVDADRRRKEIADLNVHNDSRSFKIPNDPRVTRVGYFLRRASIDELPQLINILRGDMSFVGPRPALPAEVEHYTGRDWHRLAVLPGLTCIWQVSGRSRLGFREQLALDLQYIHNRGFALDLKILLKTAPAVLTADGAY